MHDFRIRSILHSQSASGEPAINYGDTMAVNLKTTRGLSAHGVKMLVYGEAGSGKTTLIKTLPAPVILSAEGGLLSIADQDIPFIEVSDMDTLQEAYEWLEGSEEAWQFQSVALDSISEIAEVCLSAEKKATKDPRAAYGNMQDEISSKIRKFRDLPGRNMYFSAKLEKSQDEMGRILYAPGMPGNKMAQAMPYFFDEILALRKEKDEHGNTVRALMCEGDGLWTAKDRSNRLEAWEAPDLGEIIRKIGGQSE